MIYFMFLNFLGGINVHLVLCHHHHHHHLTMNLRVFMCQNEMVEKFRNKCKKKRDKLITNNEFEMIDFKSCI